MTTTINPVQDDSQQVTAVIAHTVKSGREKDYEQWLHDISAVAQQFEGHAGVSFIRPQDSTNPEYAIILRFDRYRNLKQWLDSPERQRWIDKVKDLIQKDEAVQTLTGLETWFTLPGRLVQQPPKRYKMAILTSLSVFILSQIVARLFGPVVRVLPELLRSLIIVTIVVFSLTYLVMPRVTRLFYRWLYPKRKRTSIS